MNECSVTDTNIIMCACTCQHNDQVQFESSLGNDVAVTVTAFSEEFVEGAKSLGTEVSENQHYQQEQEAQQVREAQQVLEDMELNLPAHQVVMTIEDDRHVFSTVAHQTL